MGDPKIKKFSLLQSWGYCSSASFYCPEAFLAVLKFVKFNLRLRNEFKPEPFTIDNLSTDLLHKICYLENPFLSDGVLEPLLSRFIFKDVFPKRIFKERFDIPSLNIEETWMMMKRIQTSIELFKFCWFWFYFKSFWAWILTRKQD